MSSRLVLDADAAALCIIDVQERLAAAMPEKVLKACIRNCNILVQAAAVLGLPVLVSEQYPRGLGHTLPEVAEPVLELPSEQVFFFDKTRFSCVGEERFDAALRETGRTQCILAGMETHVCVYQTARDLALSSVTVHVPRDAVVSRTMANWEIGLQLASRAGGVVSCTEAVVFDLLKVAGTDEFRAISRLVR